MEKGSFVISLDFEIYWGVWDLVSIDKYKNNLLGVRKAIPAMLNLFEKYNIHVTFSTVGFLFFDNKQELLNELPVTNPKYTIPGLSPYEGHLNTVGSNETEDPFHFAPSLIKQIQQYGQEIGSHTFSHYYCLENGQTIDDFRADIRAAKNIANKKGISLKSLVFPRNQYSETYLKVCKEEGITSFRGNENAWVYKAHKHESETFFRRICRFADAHINLTGHHCYTKAYMKNSEPINIPSSRFLKPYSRLFSFLDWMRLKRITKSMSHAAKNELCYHLWWHPHNFGINLQHNINFLEKILRHFSTLNIKYNFQSMSMTELSEKIQNEN